MPTRCVAVALAAIGCLLVDARSASAFEAWDGRVQLHGFGQVSLRTLNNDYSDDWDLSHWYWILNLELELDILPDGWGPIVLMSGFARVEVRYDCVWTRACGIGSSADLYGDRANKAPTFLTNAKNSEFTGTTVSRTSRPVIGTRERLIQNRRVSGIDLLDGFAILFESKGPDQILGTADDPAPLVFSKVLDYGFLTRRVRGPDNGQGTQFIGPWKPKDWIHAIGLNDDYPDPFNPAEISPVLQAGGVSPPTPAPGFALFPLRPSPMFKAEQTNVPRTEAKGLYFPSAPLARMLGKGESFNNFDQNFRQAELEWNRGASQQDEKELKEAYLDIEFFEGRLWLRLGKQTIIWGKTELFRSQDQFNPQDIGLFTLAGLEESRIGLWAARATWSFYDVGPFEDVRLELAANYDEFEPTDLGRCGEPYAPLPVCSKAFGLLIHGFFGLGLAGEIRPDDPWDSTRGIEGGARLEWRWRRFSFSLTDFYGFEDIPFADPLFNFERNVDPRTGRPRRLNSRGGCDPDGLFGPPDFSSCLPNFESGFGPPDPSIPGTDRRFVRNTDPVREDVLRNHSANQQLFHTTCAATVGFIAIFPGLEQECSLAIFGSPSVVAGIPVARAISLLVAGGEQQTIDFIIALATGLPDMVVEEIFRVTPLSVDDPNNTPFPGGFFGTLDDSLTAEQRAMLGCGPFYGTSCDEQGIDLMNAEASALLQSFPGFDGTPIGGFRIDDPSFPQPGTIGFNGGPVCTRFVGGQLIVLPGCRDGSSNRAPGDPGQNPNWQIGIDGNPVFDGPASRILEFNDRTGCNVSAGDDLLHPWTCQTWQNELAAASWNFLQLLVLFSTENEGDGVFEEDEFDPDDPVALDRCSVLAPQFCSQVQDIMPGTRRNDVRAGGNGRFGRRDFNWHGTQELVLRYEKRNVLGFSMDFAEDVTKTSWGLEFTWVEGLPQADADSRDGLTRVDEYRLTISMDRPTFVNFLNANRTLFFNTQVFVSYTDGYAKGFQSNGPWNMLATFTTFTGYFQDRLLTIMTLVYDVQSNSGAVLPLFIYRFTETFSVSFGLAQFFGRFQEKKQFVTPRAVTNNVRDGAYREFVENGLAPVRDRDEFFMGVRYTF